MSCTWEADRAKWYADVGSLPALHDETTERMKDKVDAIYDLREAAEEHGLAIADLTRNPADPDAKDAVLEARSKLEAATAEAIDSCHHCGEAHATADHESATASG